MYVSGITLDVLILTLNNKKIHCPGTVQTVQWKYLSYVYLIKAVLFGSSSKTLPKLFSKPFDKKTTEKLKTFREVNYLANLETQEAVITILKE